MCSRFFGDYQFSSGFRTASWLWQRERNLGLDSTHLHKWLKRRQRLQRYVFSFLLNMVVCIWFWTWNPLVGCVTDCMLTLPLWLSFCYAHILSHRHVILLLSLWTWCIIFIKLNHNKSRLFLLQVSWKQLTNTSNLHHINVTINYNRHLV